MKRMDSHAPLWWNANEPTVGHRVQLKWLLQCFHICTRVVRGKAMYERYWGVDTPQPILKL